MIVEYQTPQEFLDASESFLEKREIENNLILGICNGFRNKTQAQDGCVFINSYDGKEIKASSIKTAVKAIITTATNDPVYVKELADHYQKNNIELKGVFGEEPVTSIFSHFYGKQPYIDMALIVHRLTTVNQLSLAPGKFELAGENDVESIAQWSMTFEAEKKPEARKNKDQLLQITQAKVAAGDIFKWIHNENVVSIAAINRKTKNTGIVGLVYTPEEHRRKGYATSHVQKLSEYILQKGFKHCGLFTDKANPISNHIYYKLGYEPIAEFVDIGYR